MKKTIIVNLLIIIILFFSADFICYLIVYNKWVNFSKNTGRELPEFKYTLKLNGFDKRYPEIKKYSFRKPVGLNYKKKPIIFFGCSYAYGYTLKDNQILSYKISKLSKRPVYNRSACGWGIQHMLYQLRRNDFYEEVKEPEYIIYIYIPDHLSRLFLFVMNTPSSYNDIYLRYENINGEIKQAKQKNMSFSGFSSLKEYKNMQAKKKERSASDFDNNFNLMKALFMESKNEAKKRYPNAKFVIFKYINQYNDSYTNTTRWNELKKDGFIIFDQKELTGEYLSQDQYVFKPVVDLHPSEKAWDIIAPKLVKKLKL